MGIGVLNSIHSIDEIVFQNINTINAINTIQAIQTIQKRLTGYRDSNRAELGAILIALLTLDSKNQIHNIESNTNKYNTHILTDSLTSIKLIQGDIHTKKFNILGRCIKNLTLQHNVKYIKVKAHSGVIGNEIADKLAKTAANDDTLIPFVMPDNIFHENMRHSTTDIIKECKLINDL